VNPLDPTPNNPAFDYVRALPWAPSILIAGAVAIVCALFALTRRHPGEASLGAVASAGALVLVFAEIGRPALGIALLASAAAFATAASLVAFSARAVPGAPRTAPGNEQRMLAVAVVGLLTGTWLVPALAVDWPDWDSGVVSALAVAVALASVGLFGLLTRRHWLSLVLAGACLSSAFTLAAAALPAGAFSSYAALFAAWGSILGTVGLALAAIALARGHGPWVESIEEPQP